MQSLAKRILNKGENWKLVLYSLEANSNGLAMRSSFEGDRSLSTMLTQVLLLYCAMLAFTAVSATNSA